MVNFATLKGVDGYRAVFPSVFNGMNDADPERVVRAVHSSVLEGRRPSTEDVQRSADRILNLKPGGLTEQDHQEILAQVRARTARRESPQRSSD